MKTLVPRLLSINLMVVFLLLGIGDSNINKHSDVHEWNLMTKDGCIEVYTRKSNQSDIKDIRIVTKFQSDIETFKSVLGDVDSYPNWVFKCMDSEKLSNDNPNVYHYYMSTDMPYPVSNRDLVVLNKNWSSQNKYFSQSTAEPDFVSEKDGLVRIPRFSSMWEVTPTSDNTIEIEYEASTDPGGYLPAWVVNLGITKGPINTIKSLKNEVEKRFELNNQY